MEVTADFSSFQKAVTDALLASTRTAGQITSEDLSFHRSSTSAFSTSLDAQNARLLHLTNRLLKAAATGSGSDLKAPQIEDEDSLEDNWRGVVDVVDDLLERADRCLDEYTGVIKRLSPRRDVPEGRGEKSVEARNLGPSKFASMNMKKPQEEFATKVDNFVSGPWKPLLKEKPHAITSLETSLQDDATSYKHPYAQEIAQYKYPAAVYSHAEPIKFTPPHESEPIFVDTEEGVREMLEELRKADMIAVDLEHHDTHSYVGLVSLMQISTRDKDWIVDTLKPWRENLHILNDVFTDPKILKVFHGSSMDMIWLQRDLGLYVVGLFDTYHASRALNFPKKSLKYLLERFAQFDAQKIYQMSDWRVRPIPLEMLDYARSDTHYLLYVFDQIRNLLVDASTPEYNLIDFVLEESKKEALQRYERPIYDREHGLGSIGWYGPLTKRSVMFTNQQFAVYRAVHEWRDMVAKELDEGVWSILSMNALFNIANALPTTTPALFAAANPITKAVKDRQKDLIQLIKKAKDEGKDGPSMLEVFQQIDSLPSAPKNRRKWLPGQKNEKAIVAESAETIDRPTVEHSHVLRSTTSRLWGQPKAPTEGLHQNDWHVQAVDAAISRIVPLPPLAQVTDSRLTSTASLPAAALQPQSNDESPASAESPDPKSSIFTIRELGKPSRKGRTKTPEGNNENDPLADGQEQISIDIGADGLTKAERKARRKEEKRLKKLGTSSDRDLDPITPTSDENSPAAQEKVLQPFDYTSAPSVLHPARHVPPVKAKKDSKKRPFDPFAKATDTPKGMKKAKKDGGGGGGKSFTFKS